MNRLKKGIKKNEKVYCNDFDHACGSVSLWM